MVIKSCRGNCSVVDIIMTILFYNLLLLRWIERILTWPRLVWFDVNIMTKKLVLHNWSLKNIIISISVLFTFLHSCRGTFWQLCLGIYKKINNKRISKIFIYLLRNVVALLLRGLFWYLNKGIQSGLAVWRFIPIRTTSIWVKVILIWRHNLIC